MSEEKDIKVIIVSMVCLLILMVCSTSTNVENMPLRELTGTQQILNEHNFSEWSIEDKAMLTEMMRLTVDPVESKEQFNDLVTSAPRYVLETYIDLMENAGY